MNDPFDVTAQLARKRTEGLQQGINTLSSGLMQAGQGMQTQQMLKQFGILTEKEQPYTIEELKKIAEDKTGSVINVKSSLPPEQQAQVATKLLEASGIKLPKRVTTDVDLDRFAKIGSATGIEYKPNVFGGEVAFKPPASKNLSVADATDLTSEQQIQARVLSRKIYGVRGAEYGLPSIYNEIRKGKSVDQIEDTLRYSGQSKEFVGPVREAAQNIMMGADINKTQGVMDFIDDSLTKGDTEGVKAGLKRATLKQAGVDDQRATVGKERTIKLLDEIQGDLNTLEKSGVDTNIFTGTAEEVARKAGTVINPEARKLATKVAAAVQNYRRSMTGVQFGMPENLEYKAMFPNINKTANFNTATINGLREVMQGDLDNFYGLSMGEENYKKLFKEQSQEQPKSSVTKVAGLDSSIKQPKTKEEYNSLPSGSIYIDTDGKKKRKK